MKPKTITNATMKQNVTAAAMSKIFLFFLIQATAGASSIFQIEG
jgi:hypothetical protein